MVAFNARIVLQRMQQKLLRATLMGQLDRKRVYNSASVRVDVQQEPPQTLLGRVRVHKATLWIKLMYLGEITAGMRTTSNEVNQASSSTQRIHSTR